MKNIIYFFVFLFAVAANAAVLSPKEMAGKYKMSEIEMCSNVGIYYITLGKVNSSSKYESMGNDLFNEYLKVGGAKLGSVDKYIDYLEGRQSKLMSLKEYLDKQTLDSVDVFYVHCFKMMKK